MAKAKRRKAPRVSRESFERIVNPPIKLGAGSVNFDPTTYLADLAITARMVLDRRWSSHQINSAVCGHMLVTWALIVNLAFFLTHTGHTGISISGFAAGAASIFFAWVMPPTNDGLYRAAAIVLTIFAWCAALVNSLPGGV